MTNHQKEKSHPIEIFDSSFTIIHEDYFDEEQARNSKKASFLLRGMSLDNITNKIEFDHSTEDNYKACILTFLSSFLYSITNFLGKVMSVYYPEVENTSTNLIRGIIIIILSHAYFYQKNIDLNQQINKPKIKIFVLFWRTVTGALCNFLLFESLKYMRISSSFTIFNLAPIFTSILTVIFLGGNLRKIDIIAFIVCFFSVILITKPAFIFDASSTEEDHPLGIFFAFIAAGLSGIAVFLNKIIAKDFDVSFNVYGMGFAFAFVSLIINPFTNNGFSTLSFVPFLIAVILSVFFYFSVFIFFSALGIGDPIKILPINYIGIVLNMIYNFFIFGQSCDFLDIIGSCLIILINIYKTLHH